MRIFLNYRREDTDLFAAQFHAELVTLYGEGNVFRDEADIELGEVWPVRLRQELDRADVVAVVIGRRWLVESASTGKPRLFDKNDWVRREIVYSLARARAGLVRIVPVMLDGARFEAGRMPLAIRRLTQLQAQPIGSNGPDELAQDTATFARKLDTGDYTLYRFGRRLFSTDDATYAAFLTEMSRDTVTTRLMRRMTRAIRNMTIHDSVPYLEQNPQKLLGFYSNLQPIGPGLPFTELRHWCSELLAGKAEDIEFDKVQGEFVLGRWDKPEINSEREAVFEEYRKRRPKAYPGPAVRIQRVRQTPARMWITVQSANYFDQVKSNRTPDKEFELFRAKTSVRKELLGEFGGSFPPFEDNRMANTLGVAVLLFSRLGKSWAPIIVQRGKDVGFMEGLHCTASGVAELGPNPGRLQLFHYDSVLRELLEEVGIEERDLTSLRLIAFCREMMRVGKPQMFFVGTTELSESELNHRMRGARAAAEKDGKYVENIGPVLLKELGESWRPRELVSMTPELAATLHYVDKLQGMRTSRRGRRIEGLFRGWR